MYDVTKYIVVDCHEQWSITQIDHRSVLLFLFITPYWLDRIETPIINKILQFPISTQFDRLVKCQGHLFYFLLFVLYRHTYVCMYVNTININRRCSS